MTKTDRNREKRLRRLASQHGLELSKSRARDPMRAGFNLYALRHRDTHAVINPPLAERWIHSWTLDDVEDYLDPEPEPVVLRLVSKRIE